MCSVATLVPPIGYGIALIVTLLALVTCVSVFHPDQLRLKNYHGVRFWSNHVLFDPRRCGYCALIAWMIILNGALCFIAIEYCR